jgi:muramidase (phage lysozyme)
MILEKGNKVLCVEDNSIIRPLIINEVKSNSISFSQKLDKGINKKFSLRKGTFTLLPVQLVSEHELKNYRNPSVKVGDKVQILHVNHPDSYNRKYVSDIGVVKRISTNDTEKHIAVDFGEDDYRKIGAHTVYPMFKIEGKVLEQSGPASSTLITYKWVDRDLFRIVNDTITEQEADEWWWAKNINSAGDNRLSPDLKVGDRIMVYDAEWVDHDRDIYGMSSTFIATVIKVIPPSQYLPEQNNIHYTVHVEDSDITVGLYGGEISGQIRDSGEYTYEGRDRWVKLPPLTVTEESDVFGQGLLDPIEPEEFEGTDEDWEDLLSGMEDDVDKANQDEPEYEYEGGKTDPEKGFVAPSKEVTDNICKVKGFCEAQGPITFGQLKSLVEEATSKRIQADMGRGVFKTLWRIIPFFVPQILLAAVGITLTRAINKIVTPALKDTRGYKEWWGKVVLKAMDIAEGDYIPDIAMGDDPLSKVFFISDGLLQMIRDKYKLKFARYVADVAAAQPDDKPVPDWFVENLLRDYLNQKFLLDPPLPIKQGTDEVEALELEEQTEVEVVDDNIGVLDKNTGGYQENRKFTPQECKILKLLSNRFEFDELNSLVNKDSHALSGEFQDKWGDTMKLIGEPLGSPEAWGKSLRWAAWITDNYDYVSSTGDGFCDIEKPLIRFPSMYEVMGDEAGWERIYRTGYIEVPAFDSDDAYEKAENHWYDYEPDMETSDYGDYESDDNIELQTPEWTKTLKEQQLPFNPDNKNIKRDHPKGEPDWSIRRGRQHYSMNVEDNQNEAVTALNTYLVKNSPFNFLGFDYYLSAVPGRMPDTAIIDVFAPMLDTGRNADKLWSGREVTYYVDLGIDDDDYEYEDDTGSPYVKQTQQLHTLPYNIKYGEHYSYNDFIDNHPDQAEFEAGEFINHPGGAYEISWTNRIHVLRNEMEELQKLFGLDGVTINRDPIRPWMRQKDSYGNENIRPGKTVPRTYSKDLQEHEEKEVDQEKINWIQNIVYSVYPHIILNLGVSEKGAPEVELWRDIYARLSGNPEDEGEASKTSKAEYDDFENKIFIYYPNMEDTEDIIRSLLHEYTHSLQDSDREEDRKLGYDNDPNEIEASEAELNWEDYLVYLQDNIVEQESGSTPLFTTRILKILKYYFTVYEITNFEPFRKIMTQDLNLGAWPTELLWLTLEYNAASTQHANILDILMEFQPEDYETPKLWEYEVSYYGNYEEAQEEEDCEANDGYGYETGDECKCLKGEKAVEDKEGYTEYEDCDDEELEDIHYDNKCDCDEWETKYYDVFYWMIKSQTILSFTPADNTDKNAYTYGYEDYNDFVNELDAHYIVTDETEDDEYDEATTWDYFDDGQEDKLLGMETETWDSDEVREYLQKAFKKLVPPTLQEQYEMISPKEMKIRDLTPQIFKVLDENFSIHPHPHGELNYMDEPMALYSYQNDSFVPLEDIYNPVMQMVEGGIQQEDIDVFVEIITHWINHNMSLPEEVVNENIYIQDEENDYSKEEYRDFINFANDELDIENEVDVHIEKEPTSDYTTGNYNPRENKVKIKNDGRKLADLLRTIAHELVHHKQNELGKINPPIPEIGGEIEDEANVDAGRLIKYYGKMKPEIYEEGKNLKTTIKKILHEQDWEQFQLDIVKQTPSTEDDKELQDKLDEPPFKNREEGNLFRKWVNKNFPEIALELQLDPEGPYDNETIKKAWLFVADDGNALGLKWIVMSPTEKDEVVDEFEPIKLDQTSETSGTQKEKALLQAIIWAEGTLTSNPYIVIYGSEMVPELTSMTADEWLESAKTKKLPVRFGGGVIPYKQDKYNSRATGAFQIMPDTLKGIIKGGILTGEDIMNPKNQDKAAIYLIGPGQAKLKWNDIGNSLTEYQMNQLSRVWASIAHSKGKGGKGNKEGSYYGQGGKSQAAFNKKYQDYLGLQIKDEKIKNEIKKELEVDDIISDSNFCAGLQLVKIPGSSNDWRSGQPSRAQLKYIIQDLGVKNVIRLNGDSPKDKAARCDKNESFKIAEEKALVEKLGATFYGSEKYGFLDSHDGFKRDKGYVKTMEKVLPILDKGNTLIHCKNGADRTGYLVAEWMQQNLNWGKEDLWNYATQYNSWEGTGGKVCKGKYGYIKYMEGFYPLTEWCKGSGQPTNRSECYACTNIDDVYKLMCKRGC